MAAPLRQRFAQIIAQMGNPFAFRSDDYVVKVEYTKDGPSLLESLTRYLQGLRAGY